jgi:hypothetical protein
VKKILSFKLFEQVYLNDINPFKPEAKYPGGLRFVNRDEALRSVRRLQEMIDRKEIEIKDGIIAAFIMSQRAKFNKFQKPGIKDGFLVWDQFLTLLKTKDKSV